MICKFEWERENDEDDHTDHACVLNEGHSGEHECHCGDTHED